MEKYGILHEYKCTCGECLLVPDSDKEKITLIKHASVGKSTHVHDWKEVTNGNETESRMLQPERPGSEA